MFASSPPAASSASSSSSAAAPAPAASSSTPPRPPRRRGLSSLRSYTHDVLHLHSHPSPRGAAAAAVVAADAEPPTQRPSPKRAASSATLSPPPPLSPPARRIQGWVPVPGGSPRRLSSSSSALPTPTPTALPTSPSTDVAMAARPRDAAAGGFAADATMSSMPPPPPLQDHPAEIENAHRTLVAAHSSASLANALNLPTIQFIPYNELSGRNRPSLDFSRVSRTLPAPNAIIKVGRYSERDSQVETMPPHPSDAPVGFKSKVVSRRHCEFWHENGQWWVRDVKSSSGTFLNHVRLSAPGLESKPWAVKDGDILQLGIDFKGGEEMIFRCVKIRIECSKSAPKKASKFNKLSHKQLQEMAHADQDASRSSTECTICLNRISPCQALFVAPCSHTWHFKCVRRILDQPPIDEFICPNCRAQTYLNAEVDEVEEYAASRSSSEIADAVNGLSLDDRTSIEATASLNASSPPQAIPTGRTRTPSVAIITTDPVAVVDGPLTPRNNAGPFVFDGSTGSPPRHSPSRLQRWYSQETLVEPASPPAATRRSLTGPWASESVFPMDEDYAAAELELARQN